MALLAIVVGVAFGLRSGSDRPVDTTEVAGNVIERTEPAVTEDPTTPAEPDPIIIPVPAPDRDEDDAPAAESDDSDAQSEAQAPAPAPAEPAPPTVGIIRDTPPPAIPDTNDDDADEDDSDEDAPRRPRRDRDRPRNPEPSPTQTPDETEPATPSPQPEDVALRTGEGHSQDTAIAENGEWLFRETAGHSGQGGDGSREAQARVVVAFNDAAKQGSDVIRSFQCQAWVTAGEGRLTTDTDHVFEVALLAIDDNGNVVDTVVSVLERHAYDLSAGETTRANPMSTPPVDLNAEDGVSYTCGVRYRDR